MQKRIKRADVFNTYCRFDNNYLGFEQGNENLQLDTKRIRVCRIVTVNRVRHI